MKRYRNTPHSARRAYGGGSKATCFRRCFRKLYGAVSKAALRMALAADGSYLPANVSHASWVDVEVEVEQSMQSYLDRLDEELAAQPGFRKPPVKKATRRRTTSTSDPDCGYINHGTKRGVGYLMKATVDCKHGIVTGIDVCPANQRESLLVLRHLERQI